MENYEITYEPILKIAYMSLRGFVESVTYRAAHIAFWEFSQKHHATQWLIDTSHLKFVSTSDQHWMSSIWATKIIENTDQTHFLAHIVSKLFFDANALETLNKQSEQAESTQNVPFLSQRFFTNELKANFWLFYKKHPLK